MRLIRSEYSLKLSPEIPKGSPKYFTQKEHIWFKSLDGAVAPTLLQTTAAAAE